MAKPMIRKGATAMPSSGGDARFLSLKDGDAVTFAALVELTDMVSIDQVVVWSDGGRSPMWPYFGADDPSHKLGVEPRYRAFLPVATKEDGAKIFAFGTSVARQLGEIAAEIGSIKGKLMKVRRTGGGLSTRYTLVALGKEIDVSKFDVPNVMDPSVIGPQTLEEVYALLDQAGISLEKKVDAPKTAAAPKSSSDGDWGDIA